MATITVSDVNFHTHPTMYTKTSLSVTRSSSSDKNVHVSGKVYFRTGHRASSYETPYYTGANRGLSVVVASSQGSSGNIGSFYGLYQNNGDTNYKDSNCIDVDTDVEFTSGILTLYIDCKFMSNGTCDQGYDNVAVGALDISSVPYNPYTPPTAPTSCTVNKTRVKPDGSLSVSWSGESGGTHGIAKFQLEMSVWRNGTQIHSYTRVSGPLYYADVGYQPSTVTIDLSNLQNYDSGSRIKLRPRRHSSVLYSLL